LRLWPPCVQASLRATGTSCRRIGGPTVKLGLHYWNYSTPSDPAEIAATLAETARIAEEAGVSGFSVMDHYFQMEHAGSAAEPMLEGYTTLGYVAARTERLSLGVLVTGVMYRHPGLLAKIVTTLDVLAARRARPRRAGGPGGGAVRAARGDPADLPADVERRQRALQRAPLPAGRDPVRSPADQPAAPPDPGRRRGREEDPAAGGALRRRLQPVRQQPRRRRRP